MPQAGKLLKDLRLDFAWNWRDFENPLLVDEDGVRYEMKVEADCPFLGRLCIVSSQE